MNENKKSELQFSTQIIILPGYDFKMISGMFTNFHQPHSTLLLIIAAIMGNEWRSMYTHALENAYRFLSYGDGSLLFIDDTA